VNIKRLTLTCLLAAIGPLASAGQEQAPCPIVPIPKEYHDSGRTATLKSADSVAIVVGEKATEPEHYAAECLQAQIERRFQRKPAVCREDDVPDAAGQVLLLGQVDTNAWLGRFCKQHKVELSADSPGHDGFVIRCLDDGPRQIVLIGGSNARGVIYGQNAFFDLLRREPDKVVFPVVSVRDWPSIAWRGRPHSVLKQHLVPGALDAYLRARLNFTDVRDDPDVKPTIVFPARKASMGLPAGRELDMPLVSRMISQSHRRGLFVYGTVSCAVTTEQISDAVKTFQELIDLGVDGLWISFDDTGAGENAPELISRVLQLGAEHGMTGRRIAITPPPKEYQTIDMEFNRKAATEWGLADAQWMFTRVPCAQDAATARRIGISGLPGWWHNLVNMRGGFLHNGGVVCPLRKDGRPGYMNMEPLSQGWGRPEYDKLRDAPEHTTSVHLWGVVGGWPEEYELGALGLWAWAPDSHNWQEIRGAVYRQVYGPSMEKTARAFDDRLSDLKDLFHLPPWRYWQPRGGRPFAGWPCRLRLLKDRAQAIALIDELQQLLAALRQGAPGETAIDPARLESVYLEPMQATLAYARKMALLDYPEYTLPDFERTMIRLIDQKRTDEAEKLLADARAKVDSQLDRIGKDLEALKSVDLYVALWEKRLSDIKYWQQRAAQRRKEMTRRFRRLVGGDVASLFPYKKQVEDDELDRLLKSLGSPPAGQLLTELPVGQWLQPPTHWFGAFCLGPFDWKGRPLVAIAYPRRVPSRAGDSGEVFAQLTVPKFEGRLVLDAFVNDTRLDNRYTQYRYMQLWANDRLIWEEDIAVPRTGKEWISLDVTELARNVSHLKLRFHVVDKRPVGDHLSVTFLGPVRLRAVQP